MHEIFDIHDENTLTNYIIDRYFSKQYSNNKFDASTYVDDVHYDIHNTTDTYNGVQYDNTLHDNIKFSRYEFYWYELDTIIDTEKLAFKYACICGHLYIVKYLLDDNIHLIDDALVWAVSNRQLDVIKYLLAHGANVTKYDCLSIHSISTSKSLLTHQTAADINIKNELITLLTQQTEYKYLRFKTNTLILGIFGSISIVGGIIGGHWYTGMLYALLFYISIKIG